MLNTQNTSKSFYKNPILILHHLRVMGKKKAGSLPPYSYSSVIFPMTMKRVLPAS